MCIGSCRNHCIAVTKAQVSPVDYAPRELDDAVKQTTEMSELGTRYAEEHGITTEYMESKNPNLNRD